MRKVKYKSHIPKVMFLAAAARPRYNPNDSRTFTGKIGIFPFTDQRQAQLNSRNRAAGTMETKYVEVNKEVYKRKIIDEVIPAVGDCWSAGARNRHIWALHDNAPTHSIYDDPEVVEACNSAYPKITFVAQPPNSPDTNILDLGCILY